MKSLFATKTMPTRVLAAHGVDDTSPLWSVCCPLRCFNDRWTHVDSRREYCLSISFLVSRLVEWLLFKCIKSQIILYYIVPTKTQENAKYCAVYYRTIVLLKLQEVPESSDAKERLSVVRSLTSWKHCSRRPDIQTSLPEKKLPSKSTYPSPECRLYASLFVTWSRDT